MGSATLHCFQHHATEDKMNAANMTGSRFGFYTTECCSKPPSNLAWIICKAATVFTLRLPAPMPGPAAVPITLFKSITNNS
jgi:hypothetical protein